MAVAKTKSVQVKNLIDPSILDRLTDGFKGFLDALVQVVENSIDWGANKVTICFYTDESGAPCVLVHDDGQGMGEQGRTTYVGVCYSESRGVEGKKGRNGTGRMGFFHHAKSSRVVEKTAGGNGYHIVLDRERMFAAWFGGGHPLQWSVTKIDRNHPIKTSGTLVVWNDLRVGTQHQQSQRTADCVIEGLAEKLSPSTARKVIVQQVNPVTRATEEFPLKAREIKGKEIKGDSHNVPSLGSVDWELFVVQKADRAVDHVMMGAMGPVCTWAEFVTPLTRDPRYRALAREIDAVLRHPQVVGYIDVPKLNNFAVNNRKAFSADLLEDELLCHALLQFLREVIVPNVESELGLRSSDIVTTDDATLVADIVKEIHDCTGVRPESIPTAVFTLNRHRIDLLPDTDYVFQVENPKPGRRYVWDDTNSGGTLNVRTGTRVTFTAKTLGMGHELIVKMMGDANLEPIVRVTINIVPHLSMRFTKATVTMEPHDRRILRLENIPKDAELSWTHQNWNGSLEIEVDGLGATAISAESLGDYEIRVLNLRNPELDVAICTLCIREEKDGVRPRRGSTLDTEFIYEGQRFSLSSSRFVGSDTDTSWLESVRDLRTIILNFEHQLFKELPDRARKAIALREIALRVAQSMLSDTAAPKELLQMAARVSARLTLKAEV